MIRTILVALDASKRAPDVFASAAELAEKFDARMLLFRVIDVPPEFPPAGHVEHADRLPDILAERARQELTALAHGDPRADVEHPVIARGEPWRAIVSAADRYDVDLVVIGSHGYHGMDLILGTTASKVVHHATRSVLIVHSPEARGAGATR